MNTLHSRITFTSEMSCEKLVFLDIIIFKTEKNFEVEIFHKETDTNSVLSFNSCHPSHTLRNIPFNAARRIKALTDHPKTVTEKLSKVKEKFITANYPLGVVETTISSVRNLDTKTLRYSKDKIKNDNILSFVHTFDPSLPQLATLVKETVSRIYKH